MQTNKLNHKKEEYYLLQKNHSTVQTIRNLGHLKLVYMEEIPFNKTLSIKILEYTPDSASLKFVMKSNMAGNAVHNTLHGGITASLIDTIGGFTTSSKLIHNQNNLLSFRETKNLSAKVATINIRIDYLRPGIGKFFYNKG